LENLMGFFSSFFSSKEAGEAVVATMAMVVRLQKGGPDQGKEGASSRERREGRGELKGDRGNNQGVRREGTRCQGGALAESDGDSAELLLWKLRVGSRKFERRPRLWKLRNSVNCRVWTQVFGNGSRSFFFHVPREQHL
jgi:hypothetical protein